MLLAGTAYTVAHAQSGEAVPGSKVRPLQPVQDSLTDPRLSQEGHLPLSLEIRPAAAMTQQDKDLAASAAAEIRKRASFNDLGYNEGDWKQDQVGCPAFPLHLFLRFTRDNGAGDVSLFSVSIPRGREGHVRVIPILRRGFLFYSPAPASKFTIDAFNQIEAEEHLGATADWSAVGMCYAALTGVRWIEMPGVTTVTLLGSTLLKLEDKGAVSVAFGLGTPAPGQWQLTFSRTGQLLRTEYTLLPDVISRPLPAVATELRGKPLPSEPVEVGKPLPVEPMGSPAGRPIPPNSEPNGRVIPPADPGNSQPQPQ